MAYPWLMATSLPSYFEDSQEADTAEHRDSKGLHDLEFYQDSLQYPTTYHKTVKTIEEADKIGLET